MSLKLSGTREKDTPDERASSHSEARTPALCPPSPDGGLEVDLGSPVALAAHRQVSPVCCALLAAELEAVAVFGG